MPPTNWASPPGATVPLTVRFLMIPVAHSSPKRPAGVTCSVMCRPLIMWPLPSKIPPKVGMGKKSASSKERSAFRITSFPTDQVSRRQFSASSRRSSASLIYMVSKISVTSVASVASVAAVSSSVPVANAGIAILSTRINARRSANILLFFIA